MSRAPGEPLQEAIYSALTQSAEVIAAVGAPPRVFDMIPNGAHFPYIVIGDDQILDDSHCEAAFEAFATIHVFSRPDGTGKLGKQEAKAIGDAICVALNAQLSLGDAFTHVHDESDPAFDGARYFYEPDGLTAHGVLTFRFLIDLA